MKELTDVRHDVEDMRLLGRRKTERAWQLTDEDDGADAGSEALDHGQRHEPYEAPQTKHTREDLQEAAANPDDEQRRKAVLVHDGADEDRHRRSWTAHREP